MKAKNLEHLSVLGRVYSRRKELDPDLVHFWEAALTFSLWLESVTLASYRYPVPYWMIYGGPDCHAVVWFGSSPAPPPPSRDSKLSLFLSLPVCRPVELARSQIMYDGEKAWSSYRSFITLSLISNRLLYCTVLFLSTLGKKGPRSGFGSFLRSTVGIQSMVDRIRNLGYISGSWLSVLRIRVWKPELFDSGIRIRNEQKIRIRDKRSGSYSRELSFKILQFFFNSVLRILTGSGAFWPRHPG